MNTRTFQKFPQTDTTASLPREKLTSSHCLLLSRLP